MRRAEDRRERIAQLVRQHRQELLAAPHAFLHLQLGLTPLGDVEERHHCANHFALPDDRVAPVFRGERRTIGAPEHLVVDVRLLAMAHRLVDRRLFRRIRRAVGPGVMNERVHLLANERRRRFITQEPRTGGIAEDAGAAEIDAVDRFGG